MISLLDPVKLRRDRPDLGLEAGDIGAVVHVHGDEAYEVEFQRTDDQHAILAALTSDDIRPTGAQIAPAQLRFLVFGGQGGGYGWRLQARNAQVIATGEIYRDKDDCLKAIRLLATEIRDAEVLDQSVA
jgi:uncharacterized protein YegP (UPF0339 family)